MALFGNRETPPVETPPVETPPADAPVTRGEFAQMLAGIGELTRSVTELAQRPVVVQGAPAAPAPEVPEISSAEIDAAVRDGQPVGDLVKQLLDQRLGKATAAVRGEMSQFRAYGVTMLGALAEQAALNGMDPDLVKRFAPEIKSIVDMCDPEMRGVMDTWKTAYFTVIGRHQPELQAEIREAAIRQSNDQHAAAAIQPGKGGRKPASAAAAEDEVPTLLDVLGSEAAIKHGMTDLSEEEFIRRMNRGKPARERYKDWSDYVKRGQDTEAQLSAMREGFDDGGEGGIPKSLQ